MEIIKIVQKVNKHNLRNTMIIKQKFNKKSTYKLKIKRPKIMYKKKQKKKKKKMMRKKKLI